MNCIYAPNYDNNNNSKMERKRQEEGGRKRYNSWNERSTNKTHDFKSNHGWSEQMTKWTNDEIDKHCSAKGTWVMCGQLKSVLSPNCKVFEQKNSRCVPVDCNKLLWGVTQTISKQILYRLVIAESVCVCGQEGRTKNKSRRGDTASHLMLYNCVLIVFTRGGNDQHPWHACAP